MVQGLFPPALSPEDTKALALLMAKIGYGGIALMYVGILIEALMRKCLKLSSAGRIEEGTGIPEQEPGARD